MIDHDYTVRTCNPSSAEEDSSQKSDPSSILKYFPLARSMNCIVGSLNLVFVFFPTFDCLSVV